MEIVCPHCQKPFDLDMDKLHEQERQAYYEKASRECIGQPCRTCGKPLTEDDVNYECGSIAVIYHGCRDCVSKGRYSV